MIQIESVTSAFAKHERYRAVNAAVGQTPKPQSKAIEKKDGQVEGTVCADAVPPPEECHLQTLEGAGLRRSCERSPHPCGKAARIRAHLEWACQGTNESTSEPKGPIVEEADQSLSKIVDEQKSDNPAGNADEGWENIDDLVLDPEMSPRAELNVEHVTHLQERIEAGDKLPLIEVLKLSRKVTSGAHRHKALKVISEKVRMGELKADSLGYPMTSEGTMIRVRYDVIPDGVDPMIYCYRQNTTHGLRPSPEDTRRVVESYYSTHPGCSAKFFAEQLQISQKAAENYIRAARNVLKKERDRLIRELHTAGLTQQAIVENVQAKWPEGKVSQALVSHVLSRASREREENKGSRLRGGSKPTPVPEDDQSSPAGSGPEAGNNAPEKSDQDLDHREEPAKAPSAFSWGMTPRGYADPAESFFIWINGLRSLRPDQYEAINEAVGRVEKICTGIESELKEAFLQEFLDDCAKAGQSQVA